MFEIKKDDNLEKNYGYMVKVIKDLLESEVDEIANLSNISSFINTYVSDLNWVGFYVYKEGELVLGPFQGGPACIRINMGKGVCGNAAIEEKIINVKNVHEYKGHIACDSNTNSELVLPIFKNNRLYGVLDLDSPKLERFTELEEKYLKEVRDLISKFLSYS